MSQRSRNVVQVYYIVSVVKVTLNKHEIDSSQACSMADNKSGFTNELKNIFPTFNLLKKNLLLHKALKKGFLNFKMVTA